MQKNPFPPTIIDEASGVEVLSQRHQDWQAGYTAGVIDAGRAVLYDLPKKLGIRLPLVGDLLSKLK